MLGMTLYCQAVLENANLLMLTILCGLVKSSEGTSSALHNWCEKKLNLVLFPYKGKLQHHVSMVCAL